MVRCGLMDGASTDRRTNVTRVFLLTFIHVHFFLACLHRDWAGDDPHGHPQRERLRGALHCGVQGPNHPHLPQVGGVIIITIIIKGGGGSTLFRHVRFTIHHVQRPWTKVTPTHPLFAPPPFSFVRPHTRSVPHPRLPMNSASQRGRGRGPRTGHNLGVRRSERDPLLHQPHQTLYRQHGGWVGALVACVDRGGGSSFHGWIGVIVMVSNGWGRLIDHGVGCVPPLVRVIHDQVLIMIIHTNTTGGRAFGHADGLPPPRQVHP